MFYIGGLIGDYYGSVYEFENFDRTKSLFDVEFTTNGKFTDDTVLSVAVMDWLNECGGSDMTLLSKKLKEWGKLYEHVGYGPRFENWLNSDTYDALGSFGNGSAMRVFPCAYYANTLEECLLLAEKSAIVTHNTENGISGAKAIAEAIYLARSGAGKSDMKRILSEEYFYDLDRSLSEIGTESHGFDATCQITVPEALICFFESVDFLDAIRKSIWIGGDSDTIACMSASIAEAYYGIPHCIIEQFKPRFPKDMKDVITKFNETMLER